MIRFYFRLSALLILLFIVCGFGLTALGSTQPINPALRGFVEGCEGIPQPCWYGIVPNVTSVQEADTMLQNKGFQRDSLLYYATTYTSSGDNCTFQVDIGFNDLTVDYIRMPLCSGLQVGDVLSVLDGTPDTLWGNCLGDIVISQGSVLIYSADMPIYSSVDLIMIYPQGYAPLGVPWHGFGIYTDTGDPGCG